MNEEDEERVNVIVTNIRPPFLDGKTIYTKQIEPISIVKDPNCDMAVLAKKGS